MIGWMQNWDTCNFRTQNISWFGQMSLPRELSVQNGRLYQKPVRELEEMRRGKVAYQNVAVSDTVRLEGIKGRKVDMELVIRPEDAGELYRKLKENGILVRWFGKERIRDFCRITIGSREQMEALVEQIDQL